MLARALALRRAAARGARPSSSSSSSPSTSSAAAQPPGLGHLDRDKFERQNAPPGVARLVAAYADVPVSRVRALSVIAHVDHGKSTLSDKLLEHTGNIWPTVKGRRQVLDTLDVERARGITVKAQSLSLIHI
jgi:hypothetical protein